MAKSYGKYDHLTAAERKAPAIRAYLEALIWTAILGILFFGWIDNPIYRYQKALGMPAQLPFDVAVLAIMIRQIVLGIRIIAIQTPNPKRKAEPPKEEP